MDSYLGRQKPSQADRLMRAGKKFDASIGMQVYEEADIQLAAEAESATSTAMQVLRNMNSEKVNWRQNAS